MDVWIDLALGGLLAWPLWRGLLHSRWFQRLITPGPRYLHPHVPGQVGDARTDREPKEVLRA